MSRPGKAQTETVTDYLQGDHRRLDALMVRCKGLVEAGNLIGATALYGEFREGLLRHIKIEEELLVPRQNPIRVETERLAHVRSHTQSRPSAS